MKPIFCTYFLDHSSDSRMPPGGASLAGLPKCDLEILGTHASLWDPSSWSQSPIGPSMAFQNSIRPREPCVPFPCPAQWMERGGRLIFRWVHTWPWCRWLGRPQNSAMHGTNNGLSHGSQTAWVQKLSLSLSDSVTLGEWLVLSEQLPTNIGA